MPVEATVTPHCILLKGNLGEKRKEARAAGAMKPGHLVKVNNVALALGDLPTVGVFASAGPAIGAVPSPMFVLEDVFIGKTINDAYAAPDVVSIHYAQPGDRIYARIAAAAAAIAIGDPLTPSNDGTLKKGNGTTEATIARAVDALDNSAGVAEAFLRVDIV